MSRPYVFISYAREDAPFVGELKGRLQESQLATWRDLDDLIAGDLYQAKIDNALRGAGALIVILSPASVKSEYVTYEWAFALGAEVPVIPILRKGNPKLHPRLLGIHCVDFSNPRRGKPWLRLLDALKAKLSIEPGSAAAQIKAAFTFDNARPVRIGRQYVIDLSISPVPPGADRVMYEIHDETFEEPKWSERNPEQDFATTIHSYGDVLISAMIRTPSGKVRVETTLHEALRHTHADSGNRAVRDALLYIKEH